MFDVGEKIYVKKLIVGQFYGMLEYNQDMLNLANEGKKIEITHMIHDGSGGFFIYCSSVNIYFSKEMLKNSMLTKRASNNWDYHFNVIWFNCTTKES